MEDKKQYCEKIYNKYKELKEKTKLEAQTLKPGGKIKAKCVSTEDVKEFVEIKEKLKECLDLLQKDQLIKLSSEPDFSIDAGRILREKIN